MKKIPLNKQKFAIVDDEDFESLSRFSWYFSNTGYAVRAEYLGKIDDRYKTRTVSMHREIMQTPEGMDTDHIDGNRLDNRRSNLRICTRSQNVMNAKRTGNKPKGVSKFRERYMARIMINGKSTFLGYFQTAEEASSAYIEAAKNIHKEYAKW